MERDAREARHCKPETKETSGVNGMGGNVGHGHALWAPGTRVSPYHISVPAHDWPDNATRNDAVMVERMAGIAPRLS